MKRILSELLPEKVAESFSERGALKTVGLSVKYCGDNVNAYCNSINQRLEWVQQDKYPLTVRLQAAWNGYSPYSYLWLGLPEKDTSSYLQDRDVFREVNKRYIGTLNNKYSFHMMTEPYIKSVPELYGIIEDGQYIHPLQGGSYGSLLDALEQNEKIIIKPIWGESGKEIYLLQNVNNGYLVNGLFESKSSISDFQMQLDNYLVMEFVQQHDYSGEIFAASTNTLRIFSIIDPKTREPTIIRAAHRFGTDQSAPVDNWDRGGHSAPVNTDTGEIKDLILLDGSRRSRFSRHPETNEQIRGITIPYWNDVCELVQKAADLHRHAPRLSMIP